MRLEGTLDAFGLPDILQLLAFTGKTGALRLTCSAPTAPLRSGVVRVAEGAICGASADTGRHMLARRVVGAGLVDDAALVDAVRAAGPTGSVVAALTAAGAVPAELLRPLAAEQVTDAVSELLRWTRGEFSFAVDEPDPDELDLRLAVADVVAEGQGRLAVWAELTELIPTTDVVLSLAVAPAQDPQCSRAEWGLLALADGARTVAEMLALLGRGEFEVMRALAGLVERGLLVVGGTGAGGGGLADLRRRQELLGTLETAGASTGAHAEAEVEVDVEPLAVAERVPVPASRPATDPFALVAGNNALAPELAPQPDVQPSPQAHLELQVQPEPVRPTLSLAVGPSDAAMTRTLYLRLAPGTELS